MSMLSEFTDFLKKYQVLGLAVAFIIGGAASKLVTALVNDLIMPLVGLFVPGGDWRTIAFPVGNAKFLVGDFLGAVVDFVIIAAVVFMIVKYIMKEKEPTKKI